MKLNISMDERLVAKVDAMAELNYTSRSGMIAIMLQSYIKQEDMHLTLKELLSVVRKLERVETDEERKVQMQQFEAAMKLLLE